jgi:hypothetical protein
MDSFRKHNNNKLIKDYALLLTFLLNSQTIYEKLLVWNAYTLIENAVCGILNIYNHGKGGGVTILRLPIQQQMKLNIIVDNSRPKMMTRFE